MKATLAEVTVPEAMKAENLPSAGHVPEVLGKFCFSFYSCLIKVTVFYVLLNHSPLCPYFVAKGSIELDSSLVSWHLQAGKWYLIYIVAYILPSQTWLILKSKLQFNHCGIAFYHKKQKQSWCVIIIFSKGFIKNP